jgi:hypothetical protein
VREAGGAVRLRAATGDSLSLNAVPTASTTRLSRKILIALLNRLLILGLLDSLVALTLKKSLNSGKIKTFHESGVALHLSI